MFNPVLCKMCKMSAFLAIVIGSSFVAAEANAGHVQTITEETAKSLCGKAWDGTGCILSHKGHDHAVTCHKDGCSNVVVTPKKTVSRGHKPVTASSGGSKQTGHRKNSITVSSGGSQQFGHRNNTSTIQHSGRHESRGR